MNQYSISIPLLLLVGSCSSLAPGASGRGLSPGVDGLTTRVEGLDHRPGLLDLYVDSEAGQVWMILPPPDGDGVHGTFLYTEGLTTGLGSNPVGLDRGQLNGPWLVRFVGLGGKVMLERPNLAFRALTEDPAERRATAESFATSVLWAGPIEERAEDGRLLVDVTSLLVRDAHGVVATLSQDGGSWSLDQERSSIEPTGCHAFPDNLELEARLTFRGNKPGRNVRMTAPLPEAVTLVQHHSLIRLPDDGYQPRRNDPRAGAFSITFQDYAAPLDGELRTSLACRHRLQKRDPSAARSAPVEPIVYYVDRGAPEPIRSALIEGASWWSAAFEGAGFKDAFRVELLPEGAHPLDVRYNVIQWVHRSTRGWSYGNAVSDPRTGEILKGHVSLGSLRVRQDRRLFEGLAGTSQTGSGSPDDPIELALARIRQLAAHEVGHTLGFAHNFTASTFDRGSVMDYPAPLVTVDSSGELDFSQAYGVGIGSWDEVAVAWLYGEFAPEQEQAGLDAILAEAAARGMRYHSDSDARPPGAAQPYANLWDNFDDPVTGLENALAVRGVALERFGEANLSVGLPRAHLEEVLAPLYLHHRYQVDAAVKVLGGVDYDHVLVGEGAPPMRPSSAEDQLRALKVLLGCLAPAVLDLPEPLLDLLAPRPPGAGRDREQFEGQTGLLFDPLGAAGTAAGLVVDGLLQPQRCARLLDQHRRDAALPSLAAVLEALTDGAFGRGVVVGRQGEVVREVQTVVVSGLIRLAEDPAAAPRVQARASAQLGRLLEEGVLDGATSEGDHAHQVALRRAISRHLTRHTRPEAGPAAPLEPPPGSPIGLDPWGLCGCSHAHGW